MLDFTRLLPGNYCTWLMAMLGADVIKVEDPGPGDYMREIGLPVEGMGAGHHLVNRGKRSIVIDLKHERGPEVALRLIGHSDALVESFRPGVMTRLGLGPELVRSKHPSFVFASLSGYGATGSLAGLAAHDLNYLGSAGLLERLGEPDGGPIVPPIPLADLIGGGLVPAIAVIAQLLGVGRGGTGTWIDSSLTEAVALLPNLITGDLLAGGTAENRGHGHFGGAFASYAIYALEDGYVAVGALEPRFWVVVCETLGVPEFGPLQHDAEEQPRIRMALQKRFSSMSRADVERLFAGRDACVTLIDSYEQVLASDHSRERGFVVDDDNLPMPVLAAPFMFDGSRPDSPVPAPRQGQHTVEVLAEAGFCEDEIDLLESEGIAGKR